MAVKHLYTRSQHLYCTFQCWSRAQTCPPCPPCHALQPLLVLGVLLALPRGVRILELDAPCAGPLLEALKRFSRLHELRIGGNGAGITWSCPGAAGLLSKLVQLRMDFRGKPIWKDEYVYPPKEDGIPTHTGGALAAATRLRSLALCVSWSDGVPALCSALPALEELR